MKKLFSSLFLLVTFFAVVQAGDLYPSGFWVSPKNSTTTGSMVSVGVTINYDQKTPPRAVTVSYYLSLDAVYGFGDTYLGGSSYLTPSLPKVTSTSFTIPTSVVSGNYYIVCVIDPSNMVVESNEQNNSSAIAYSLYAQPDLIFTLVSANVVLTNGNQFLVTGTVKNNNDAGGLSAEASVVNVYLSDDNTISTDDVLLTSAINIPLLTGGAGSNFSKTLTMPDLGGSFPVNKYLLFKADATQLVTESNESNNTSVFAVTISKPDLTISGMNGPTAVYNAQSFYLNFQVQNNSIASSLPCNVAYYYSDQYPYSLSNSIALYPANSGIGQIAGSASVNVGVTLNLPVLNTTFPQSGYLYAIVDYNNSNNELVETNNISSIPVTLQACEDLLVYSVRATGVSCNGPVVCDNMTVFPTSPMLAGVCYYIYGPNSAYYLDSRVVVKNIGSVDLFNVEIKSKVNDDSTLTLYNIPAGGQIEIFQGFGGGGPVSNVITVDPNNLIAEFNELNNTGECYYSPMMGGKSIEVEQDENDVAIFPNPAQTELNISVPDQASVISLFDESGKMVWTANAEQPKVKIDVSGWNKGIYVVQIKSAKSTTVKKFIIE